MRKALGLLACTSLAAAGLWTAFPGGTTRPVSADQPSSTRGTVLSRLNPFSRSNKATSDKDNAATYRESAEKLLKEAQALALRGDLDGARRLAERAQSFPVEWSPNERSPEKFLAQLDARTNFKNQETVIAENTKPQPRRTPTAETKELPDAKRVANSATETPRSRIQPMIDEEPMDVGTIDDAAADDLEPTAPIQPASRTTAAKSPAQNAQLMAKAKLLMQQARQDIAQGDYAAAREKAEQAADLDVAYTVFDQRPQQILAELDRRESQLAESRRPALDPEFESTSAEPIQPPSRTTAARSSSSNNSQLQAQAKQLIQQARQDITRGDLAAAREKAEQAADLDVAYTVFETRPQQLLAEIDRLERGIDAPARRSGNLTEQSQQPEFTEPPFESEASSKELPFDEPAPRVATPQRFQTAKKTAPQSFAEEIPFEDDVPAATSARKAPGVIPPAQTDRQLAQQLLQQAEEAAKQGNLEQARSLALEAQDLDVTYGLFDLRPEQVLARIDRADNNLTIARGASRTKPEPTTRSAKQLPFDGVDPRASSLANDVREPARTNVPAPPKAIKTLNPNDLIDEVMAADDLENVSKPAASKPTAPIAADTRNVEPIDDPVTARVKQQATGVLQQARQDLVSGRLEAAREKAIAAQKLNATYGLFDDRPEVLLDEIDTQLAAKSQSNKKPNTTTDPKAQALALLKQARADIAAERWEDAKQKALAASALNVAYDVFDDRPEQILAAVQRATNPSPQKSLTPETPVQKPTQVANQTPPKAGDLGPLELTPAAAIEEATQFTAIHPEGPSAQQLFREGQIHLQSGNKAAAYQAFVRAYQSGQKLDARRHQQLQDYLRELSPRRGAKPIQLASGSDNDANATEPGVLDLQRPIDIVSERQKVQLDRLRSEVLNAVSRADRLREKDPVKAIEILDQAMANVETAPLEKSTTASLLLTLRKTRSEIEGLQKIQEPNLALAKRNAEVLQSINRDTAAKVRIEKEFANLTKEYNELMNQRRYAEAEVVAKQAKELDPDNPVSETMVFKSVLARRVASNEQLIRDKEEGFWSQLDAVETAAIPFDDRNPIRFSKDWKDITDRRRGKYNTDTRVRTPEEQRIENSLSRPISLHFENAPLKQVIDHVATVADVNVVIDKAGLDDEALTISTPVSINVDSIQLKNALELMLEPLNMGYTIKNEVLKITSEQRLQGEAILATYSVADLVVPIQAGQPNMNLFPNTPFMGTTVGGQMSVPTSGGLQGGQFQVGNATPAGTNPWLANSTPQWQTNGNAPGHDFRALIDLIVSTCEPSSWEEIGGSGHIKGNETTLSLVIRQTQKVHDEIRDLLEQLRRLQDLQVTIEVRFVSVSDNFFERIGIDFDFDLQDSIGGPNLISGGQQGQAGQGGGQGGQQQQGGLIPIPPFGSILSGQQQGQQQQGQQGQQAQQGQGGGNFFTPAPNREFTDRDNYRSPTAIGLNSPETFTDDLDVAFRQGSFGIGVPDFGRFDANAGLNVGFAILSDIETFFFINAAQGDRRNNIMSAPKVTMFNGQTGTVFDGAQRPFVTQLVPVVGAFAVGYQPIITQVFEGVGMSVQAVISADRRYVRLAVTPSFNVIREVQAFTFVSAGGQQGQAGQAGGQGGQRGGGGQGGFGGGQQGFGGIGGGAGMEYGGIYNHGLFGTAMGDRADIAVAAQSGFGGIGGFGGQGGFGGGGFGGGGFGGGGFGGGQGGGGQGGFQAAGAGEVTVQQPVVAQTLVLTTVAVPDGGTVLLGGVKRLSESRNMAGVPILNKIPYISRLFKNTGVGRETQSLMLMVTPRIVILEEEESLLGIPN